jgi:hypothetical protein
MGGKTIHIISTKIVKHEEVWRSVSTLRHFGIRDLEETKIWNCEFQTLDSRNPERGKPFQHFGDLGIGRYRRQGVRG